MSIKRELIYLPENSLASADFEAGENYTNVIEIENGKSADVSDGYHTFRELYDHRMALTIALMKSRPELSFRSRHHYPGGDPMFEGFFIVGMYLPTGIITYHYKLEHWDKFNGIEIKDHAPKWDGHTPADVVKRLLEWMAA